MDAKDNQKGRVMEASSKENIDRIEASLNGALARIAELEHRLSALEQAVTGAEPVDVSFEDIQSVGFIEPEPVGVAAEEIEMPESLVEEPETVPEVAEAPEPADPAIASSPEEVVLEQPVEDSEVEDIPETVEPEEVAMPEPETGADEPDPLETSAEEIEPIEAAEEAVSEDEDMPEDVFGGFFEDEPEPVNPAPKPASKPARTSRPVIDAMAGKSAWKTDLPGSPVGNVRSAISMNDRVMFIRSLFRDDADLYGATLAEINNMKSLAQVESYIHNLFPEWNMESDTVYRFMMAVRRKVR